MKRSVPRTIAMGLLAAATLVGAGCLPNVQSVKERRAEFDRDAIQGKILVEKVPDDMQPVGAVFGEQIKLLGYTLDPKEPPPGGTVYVTYYWECLKPTAEEFQVFIHGDAVESKQSRIHGDHFPGGGKYPTDVWRKGDIIKDRFRIFIPPGYGGKHLGLFTGLYKDSYRMPVTEAGVKARTGDNRSRAVDIYFN